MAASSADVGYNAQFGIGATPTYVAEVVSITPPGLTRETVDVTHLKSDNMFREHVGALKDAGEASITINYIPTASASDVLLTAFNTDAAQDFTILFPSGTLKLTFKGIVTGYEIGDIVADDKMSATFTVKATGTIAIVAVP